MITNGALGYMKSVTGKFLTDTCTIEQRSLAVGEFGQPVEAYTVVSTSVACRVTHLSQSGLRAQAETVAGREAIGEVYRLICPAGTALEADQRITLSSGDVYYVVDVLLNRTDETDTQATIVRVRD